MRRWLVPLVLVAFAAGFFKAAQRPAPSTFAMPVRSQPGNDSPYFHTDFASSSPHVSVHAASLVEMSDGRVRAFWFAGSREGASDVEIRSAVYDPAQQQWSAEQTVVARQATAAALHRYIAKLGNPVPARAADGSLWLYYVTVSVGGWAGSSITAMRSTDDGANWDAPQRLVTSPFLNLSTLVKGTPFLYADGTLGLPVYHEFIGKFGELLRFDRNGEVIDKQRLSAAADHGLQPVLLPESANKALVLMRHSGDEHRKVLGVATADAGRHWSAPEQLALWNPDAALTAAVLDDGRMLAVLNDQAQGRNTLSLELSADGGRRWRTIYQLEQQPVEVAGADAFEQVATRLAAGTDARAESDPVYAASARQQKCDEHGCGFEFSYPYLIRSGHGMFDLAYTWNRSYIKHIRFNQAWLEQQAGVTP